MNLVEEKNNMISICTTIPVIRNGVVMDEAVAIINIDMPVIRRIQEDVETKNTIIVYHSGQSQNINVPFATVMAHIMEKQQIIVYDPPKVKELSPNVGLLLYPAPPKPDEYGYQPDTDNRRNSL